MILKKVVGLGSCLDLMAMVYGKRYAWEKDSFTVALDGRLVRGIGSGYGMIIGWRGVLSRSIS